MEPKHPGKCESWQHQNHGCRHFIEPRCLKLTNWPAKWWRKHHQYISNHISILEILCGILLGLMASYCKETKCGTPWVWFFRRLHHRHDTSPIQIWHHDPRDACIKLIIFAASYIKPSNAVPETEQFHVFPAPHGERCAHREPTLTNWVAPTITQPYSALQRCNQIISYKHVCCQRITHCTNGTHITKHDHFCRSLVP